MEILDKHEIQLENLLLMLKELYIENIILKKINLLLLKIVRQGNYIQVFMLE